MTANPTRDAMARFPDQIIAYDHGHWERDADCMFKDGTEAIYVRKSVDHVLAEAGDGPTQFDGKDWLTGEPLAIGAWQMAKLMFMNGEYRAEITRLTADRDANVQAKLALMKAGTFADGVRAAAKIVHGEELIGGRYRTWPQWGMGNREREDRTVSLVDALEVAILALADLPANEGEKL